MLFHLHCTTRAQSVFPIRLHLHTASTRLGEESGVLGNVCISSQQHLNTHFLLFVSVNVNNTVLRFIINAGMSVWIAFLPYWRYSIYITCSGFLDCRSSYLSWQASSSWVQRSCRHGYTRHAERKRPSCHILWKKHSYDLNRVGWVVTHWLFLSRFLSACWCVY